MGPFETNYSDIWKKYKMFRYENAFENVVCEVEILFEARWLNSNWIWAYRQSNTYRNVVPTDRYSYYTNTQTVGFPAN